jgi:arylsulfatase A-like enzyme
MKTKLILTALALGLVTSSAADKPNILYIMSDDHAAHGIGAYGGRLAKLNPTPNIDRLANEGVRLSNCFCVNSICTPSRATIMTGQYSHKNGVTTLIGEIPAERQTLAIEMKKAGYTTAMVGKWHLKAEPGAFDFYTVLPGQGLYFNPIFRVRGPKPWPSNTISSAKHSSVHSSDAITDVSLKWLKQWGKQKKNRKPFFLMHHFKAPHDNFENAERYDWLYEDIDIPEPEGNSLWERGKHGPVGYPQYGTSVGKRNTRRNMGHHMFVDEKLNAAEYKREAYQRYLKKFLRCVKGVDDNIGRLITHLKQTGELENTIIVYSADQGFMLGEHDYIDKRWMYEESQRMPFIIRHPKSLPSGKVVDDIVNNVDYAPTLLNLAGVASDKMPKQFQGTSFLPNLKGDTPPDWKTATYYRYWMHMAHHDNPAHYGIRTKTHKLIFFYGRRLNPKWYWNPDNAVDTRPHWELYDLTKDPHEMNNLYGHSGAGKITVTLKQQLFALRKSIGDTDDQYPEVAEALELAE